MFPLFSLMVSLSLLLSPVDLTPSPSETVLESLSTSLIAHGFENVAVLGDPSSNVTIYYENRIYRYHLRAMGVLIALISEELDSPWNVTMVPMKAGVPIVSVSANDTDYREFISGQLNDKTFGKTLLISTNPPVMDINRCGNRSFRRIDLSAGPSFVLEFDQLDESMRVQLNIVPQMEVQLHKGILTTGQVIVPLIDEIEEPASGVRPGRVTLDWLIRQGRFVGLSRAGIFNYQRYGFSIGGGGWVWGDKLLFTGNGDLTGQLALDDGVWEYTDLGVFTYSLAATYWYPHIDVTLKATFGRFLGEENGGRIDLIRTMGELDIGFFAIKTRSDTLGGFLVNMPLPVSRYSTPSVVRFKTVPYFLWEYRNEVSSVGRLPGGGLSIQNLYKSLAPVFIRNNVSEWIDSRRLIS